MKLLNLLRNDKGQGMAEYGLILGLVAIVVIAAFTALGGSLGDIIQSIADALAGAAVAPAAPAPAV